MLKNKWFYLPLVAAVATFAYVLPASAQISLNVGPVGLGIGTDADYGWTGPMWSSYPGVFDNGLYGGVYGPGTYSDMGDFYLGF